MILSLSEIKTMYEYDVEFGEKLLFGEHQKSLFVLFHIELLKLSTFYTISSIIVPSQFNDARVCLAFERICFRTRLNTKLCSHFGCMESVLSHIGQVCAASVSHACGSFIYGTNLIYPSVFAKKTHAYFITKWVHMFCAHIQQLRAAF